MTRSDPSSRVSSAVARICVGLAAVAAAPIAVTRAEDDGVRERGGAADRQAEQEANLVELGANFDSNVFEQAGGGWVIRGGAFGGPRRGPGEAGSPALARVRAAGAARLERVERSCGLTAAQRRRLELALEADVRRCVSEIEEVRRRYATVTVNMREREGQQTLNRFHQDAQRCRQRLLTVFDESSLFAESLATVLDDDQRARLAEETAARVSFRWRSLVATALLRLDDTLALTQEQHLEIERLLLEKVPPLRLDTPNRQRNEQLEQMLVYAQLAEVDQKALRAAVGEDRWTAVLTLANQGRQNRSLIEMQGLIELKRR